MHGKFKVELSVAALACLPQELLQSKEENPLKVFVQADLQMATQYNYLIAMRQENVAEKMFLTKSKQKKKKRYLFHHVLERRKLISCDVLYTYNV